MRAGHPQALTSIPACRRFVEGLEASAGAFQRGSRGRKARDLTNNLSPAQNQLVAPL